MSHPRDDRHRDSTIARVTLSNPGKLMFPDAGISKRDVARYYEAIGRWIVPHLRRRPLSLVRCPDGWKGQCFYQRRADPSVHASVDRVDVTTSEGPATYLTANSVAATVGLVQWGVLELHPWGSSVPRLERPDRLIFDLDPDESVAWEEVVAAVHLVRQAIEALGLAAYLKTTGGKGLHVVVPIRATLDWDEGKGFARSVAESLVSTFPERFTAAMSKARRKGMIFIDYLRNAHGATAVAAYSLRARAGAPVATPIHWSELERDVRFDHFNLRSVPARLANMKKDPWSEFFGARQTVTKAMLKRVGR